MLIKLNSRLRRDVESGATLAETVVAVAIIVLCLTLAGMALAASLQTSNQSSDMNKAYQLINKQFAIARQVSYDKLGVVPSEAQKQLSLVQTTLTQPVCDPTTQDCSSSAVATSYDTVYNRQIPAYTYNNPGAGQTSTQTSNRITWCGDSASNPTYNSNGTYNGERRVGLTYSNTKDSSTGNPTVASANSDDETDSSSNYTGDPNATPQAPLYCAWYQFGQGNGDPMFVRRTTNNPAGGLGTIFVVETDVTWVDSGSFDGVNSNAANCYNGSSNCFMAKRITTTVRWVNTNSAGKSQLQVATASFVRAPTIADCAPVSDSNFKLTDGNNAAPDSAVVPAPVPSASSGIAGVSCG